MTMLVDYRFEPDCHLVRLDVTCLVDLQEVLKVSRALVNHPEFVPGMDTVWNLLEADYRHLRSEDIEGTRRLPRVSRDERGDARVILVVRDDLGHGLARMFFSLGGQNHLEYQVTRSLPDAYRLLGLPG